MIVIFDNILVLDHDYEDVNNKLKLVLSKNHELKMFKSYLRKNESSILWDM